MQTACWRRETAAATDLRRADRAFRWRRMLADKAACPWRRPIFAWLYERSKAAHRSSAIVFKRLSSRSRVDASLLDFRHFPFAGRLNSIDRRKPIEFGRMVGG